MQHHYSKPIKRFIQAYEKSDALSARQLKTELDTFIQYLDQNDGNSFFDENRDGSLSRGVDVVVMFLAIRQFDCHGAITDTKSLLHLVEQMLNGAYFLVEDGDLDLYEQLTSRFQSVKDKKGEPLLRKRLSSHHSTHQQYAIFGKGMKECLFGKKIDPATGVSYTWFQLERHKTGHRKLYRPREMLNLLMHLCDYMLYRVTGRNIGPYGQSYFTEATPYRVGKSNR